MGVSSSESHDLTAFYEMLSASFGVLSQNTGFYPSLDRIIETMLGPLNLGPGGGSYNKPISRLHRDTKRSLPSKVHKIPWPLVQPTTQIPRTCEDRSLQGLKSHRSPMHARKLNKWNESTLPETDLLRCSTPNCDIW